MSSRPGLTLESFLMWNYDLIVDDDGSANPSLQIAEAIGIQTRRRRVTADEFARLVQRFEPYRQAVENRLAAFDEESQSWRDYSVYVAAEVPPEVY